MDSLTVRKFIWVRALRRVELSCTAHRNARAVLALLLWLLPPPCTAVLLNGSESGNPADAYVSRTWTTKDGLPQDSVNAVIQTRDGFLWIGTNAGLARFDGVRFRNFGLQDGLRAIRIACLAEDTKGRLWIGTSGAGVSLYENGRFTNFGPDNGFPTSADIVSMLADRDGTVWIGTLDGLVRGRGSNFVMVYEESGLPRKQIRSIVQDRSGKLWISVLKDSLYTGENGRFARLAGDGPFKGSVYKLLADTDGTIWAGAGNGRLWCWRDGGWNYFHMPHGLPNASIVALAKDQAGTLWAGVEGNGFYRMDGEKFTRVPGDAEAVPQSAREVFVDRDGAIWGGLYTDGLLRISPRILHYWDSKAGLGQSTVTSFVEDQAGGWWTSTIAAGVLRYSNGQFTRVDEPATKGVTRVYCMTATADGSVWSAGEQCITRFRPGEPAKVFNGPPVANEAIRALCPDGDSVWIGTYHSTLLKCDADGPKVIAPPGSFNGSITSIVREAPDTLWIGSFGALHRWERGRIKTWTTADGLLTSSIRAIHRNPDGTLWLGTLGGGLARMKDGKFVHITKHHGLIDDVISQIVVDDYGAFWLGCNVGIMRLERDELEAVADGEATQLYPRVFDRNDGLLREECTGGQGPLAFKARDGRVFFPTTRGLAAIDPREAQQSRARLPAVSIDEVRVDDAVIRSDEPRIGPGHHRVAFSYTVPTLSGGEWVRFRHKLEGLNNEWVYSGGTRQVSYDGLPPGSYVFHVGASGALGEWAETAGQLAFVIEPHFWQTLWFRAGGVALIATGTGAAAWAFMRRKHRLQILAMERERRQHAELAHAGRVALLGELSASIAHELKQPLAAILSNAQAGLRFLKSDEVGEIHDILRDIAEADRRASEIIGRMREMVKKGEAQLEARDLNADLHQVLTLLRVDLLSRGISVATDLAPGLPMIAGDHIQLQQVLLNLIINGCDAMQANPPEDRHLRIETAREGEKFARVSVIDRGSGVAPGMIDRIFDPFYSTKSHGLGMGLSICQAIIKAHGGKIWVENNHDRGATFHFTLRVGSNAPC